MRTAATRKDSRPGRTAGFTLLELLVVIAIISVLMAISLPALGYARKLTQRVKCGSNLRNLGIAWTSYLDNNNGRFYQAGNASVNFGGWRGLREWWPRPLNPYVLGNDPNSLTEQSAQVFACPADRGGIPGSFLHQKAYRVHGTSYQTNIFLIGQDYCDKFSEPTAELDAKIAAQLPGLTRQRVTKRDSLLLLVGDYGWINQWKPKPHVRPEYKELAEWHGKPDYHNLAFLDGHVAFQQIRKGSYVAPDYYVLPFENLFPLAREVQGPVP
ncbi:MAG: prepilin-type N-terminal cleavage/methylation domain-containing protein [Planctomycetes bacterium]|jgi:prepilin-type N-terminal cleavage/methylation domain-containing protein/prepilin-type processing-associated H-X9-DG protein|nr:prepilin-type N-terminal cleavage/methylation domain-containing protein [Planctomycetota bacterium]